MSSVPGEADALGEARGVLAAIDGIVDVGQATAAGEERVGVAGALGRPVAVLEEDQRVSGFQVVGAWPALGGGDADVLSELKQLLPNFFPGWVIVLSDAVIFWTGD